MAKGSIRYDYVAGASQMSKVKQSLSKDAQTRQQYRETLLTPLNVTQSARIPDMCGYPSTVFTDTVEHTINIAQDNGANRQGGFYIGVGPGGIVVYRESAASTDAAIVFTNAPETVASGKDSVIAGYATSRLVGAGFMMEFIGNDSNNAGVITTAYICSADFETAFDDSYFTTAANLNRARMSYSSPLKNGVICHYVPLDPNDFTYRRPYNSPDLNFDTAFADRFKPVCAWQVHANANTGINVRITVVGHFEGLPVSDSLVVGQLGDAPNDVIGLQMAINEARLIPLIQQGPVVTPDADANIVSSGTYYYNVGGSAARPKKRGRKI